jgi:hypothetical protein
LPIIYCDPKLKEGLSKNNSLLVGIQSKNFAKGFEKLKNKNLLKKMSAASLDISKDYSAKKITDDLLEVYALVR